MMMREDTLEGIHQRLYAEFPHWEFTFAEAGPCWSATRGETTVWAATAEHLRRRIAEQARRHHTHTPVEGPLE